MIEIFYKDRLVVSDVRVANNFWSRLMGYMFRLKPHCPAILFLPAVSIHTFFMNFNLDIIFLDKRNRILKIYRDFPPWRHTWFYFNAKTTLEIPTGVLPVDIQVGDILEIRHV